MALAGNNLQGPDPGAIDSLPNAPGKASEAAGFATHSAGLILAGGLATRMQRGENPPVDKGLVALHGNPLISYVHAQMQPWVHTMYISANRNRELYCKYGRVITDDPLFGSATGPLAGIASALSVIEETSLFVWPVDVPAIPPGLLGRLRQSAENCTSPIAYVTTDEGAHPLCLWLHRSVAPSLSKFLISGGRKVQHWLQDQRACPVVVNPQGMELVNVNTPDDLNRLHEVDVHDSEQRR